MVVWTLQLTSKMLLNPSLCTDFGSILSKFEFFKFHLGIMAKKVSKMVRILLKIAHKPNLTQPNLGFPPGSQLIFEFLKLHLSILAKSLQNLAWTIKKMICP